MKKIIAITITMIMLISTFNIKVKAADPPPSVGADGAVLMDATTGEILYSKNMDAAYPPASTTKTMTALLTLENAHLDDKVTVGKNPPIIAARTSNISLVEGEQVTVKDLLYGLFLQSGNDCAETLAEYIGGTSAKFVEMMNNRAKQLGCTDTNFVNPSGLYDPNHKTSAKDLALIVRELSKHPEFKEISTTLFYKIPPTNKFAEGHPFSNENKIVNNKKYSYPGYEGGKTGYTTQSEYSFTAVASRNGEKLVVALVHQKEAFFYSDAENLLDWGFKNFELTKLYNKGDKVSDYKISSKETIPLLADEDYYYVRNKGSKDTPILNIDNLDLSKKSFNTGDTILQANFTLNDKPLPPLKLDSGSDHIVKPVSTMKIMSGKNSYKNIILGILALPILFVLGALITKKRRMKKRLAKRYSNYFYK